MFCQINTFFNFEITSQLLLTSRRGLGSSLYNFAAHSRKYTFLSWLLGYVEKRFDKKVKVNSKIYDVTDWTTNKYNKHIAQYLKN